MAAVEAADDTEDRLPAGSLVVRAALEHASATLAAIRRGRPGESARGERLLVLRETADRMFGTLIALAETVAVIAGGRQGPRASDDHPRDAARRYGDASRARDASGRRAADRHDGRPLLGRTSARA